MDLCVDYQINNNEIHYGIYSFKNVDLNFLEEFYKHTDIYSSNITFRILKMENKKINIYKIGELNKLKIFIKNEKNNGRK